ncbi:MAG: ferrochelatase [Gammaproteobacteria bacterium]|nr:ferrochelatase [Gammaproteobacteria bacterium]MYF02329.1 ferrochelatase [Gammaproteobacteria bacterium]
MMQSVGIIVANLGSPASPARKDVAKFLGDFLSDPYVVDLPTPIRQFLARGIIAIPRSKPSSEAYASIWDSPEGPLRRITSEVAETIQENTGIQTVVGMRYGQPSIDHALDELSDCQTIVLAMLYPQHADSTRTTTIRYLQKVCSDKSIRIVPVYYQEKEYLNALVRCTKESIDDDIEQVVISFHSLPIRHILKADPTKSHCLKFAECCDVESIAHETCYKHQCQMTATHLGNALGLPYSIGYQSRLGRLPWLEPSTVDVISHMAKKGVKRIAVTCPAFVVDNLETLEEIGIRARDIFLSLGGEKLQLLPCLNTDTKWIEFFSRFILQPLKPNEYDK